MNIKYTLPTKNTQKKRKQDFIEIDYVTILILFHALKSPFLWLLNYLYNLFLKFFLNKLTFNNKNLKLFKIVY